MRREVLQVNLEGRALEFAFPAGGNIVAHLREIFAGKTYPLPRLPAGYRHDIVVDIGANVGASALWFQAAARPRRIVCFEPSAENHACLAANLAPFPHAEAHPWGLFSRDREAPLYQGQSQCMQHSLVPSIEVGSRAETIVLKRASAEFDRLGLDRISILKIDTEGCEVPILEDLGKRLDRVDQIYVEYHSEEDRRAIDALLARRFSLAFSSAFFVHRGVVLYLAHELAEAVESLAALRLARPAA